jgi:hypothetical protein
MGFFKSISNWIFGEERKEMKKELEALNKNMNTLIDLLVEKETKNNQTEETKPTTKPATIYKGLKKVGSNTIVVLHDGEILSTEKDIFNEVKACSTLEEIKNLFLDEEEMTKEKNKEDIIDKKEELFVSSKDNFDIFRGNNDFEITPEGVKLKGVKHIIPPLVLADFVEICEKLNYISVSGDKKKYNEEELLEKYNSLIGFWQKLSKSPLSYRENVLRYCKNNDLHLDEYGHIIGYRRIKTYMKSGKKEDTYSSYDDVDFVAVSLEYERIRKQKKGTGSFSFVAFADGTKKAIPTEKVKTLDKDDRVIGVLKTLYEKGLTKTEPTPKKDNRVLYSSSTNYGKHIFGIGDIYAIPKNEINVDAGNCAAGGLHFASVDYNYGSFGDVPVVVLVDPSKAITVPTGEKNKGRTIEMKIAMINPNKHGVHIDKKLLKKASDEYNEHVIKSLEEVVETGDVNKLSYGSKYKTNMTMDDVKSLLEAMKNRTVAIS